MWLRAISSRLALIVKSCRFRARVATQNNQAAGLSVGRCGS